MQKFLASLALVSAFSLTVPMTAGYAQATRTWVSGVGDDANPCSRTAPCKTFAGAISKTAASGTINCLDPAGFGAVTITKAIIIDCSDASNGGISSPGVNGIIINAGVTDRIVLRGISIFGMSPVQTNGHGISFIKGGSLVVDNVQIQDIAFSGINFAPSTPSKLFVSNSHITNAGNSGTNAGILIRPTAAADAGFSITETEITNGTFGIVADGTGTTGRITGLVRASNVSGNSQNGITTSIGTATNATIMVDNVSVVGNANKGLAASGVNAGMLVGNSSVFSNGQGIFPNAGSAIVSYGNNRVNGNSGNDGAFSATIPTK